jgi:rRNA methylases
MKPRIIKIYSKNNDYQYVETLRRNREKRQRAGEFFIEGVRPLNQALHYRWPLRALLYARERKLSDWAMNILRTAYVECHYELPPQLYAELSNKSEPSELIALVKMPADDLARIPLKQHPLVVAFDRPASPGNLGTIIRSCDALHADGLIISGHSVDLYDPETISATTGSFFALPTVRIASQKDLLPWLDAIRQQVGHINVVGSDERGDCEADAHDFTQPTLLVVGNETWGMSAAYRDLCDTVVNIPIAGSASSLNVASATSILLYEIDRQRRMQLLDGLNSQ